MECSENSVARLVRRGAGGRRVSPHSFGTALGNHIAASGTGVHPQRSDRSGCGAYARVVFLEAVCVLHGAPVVNWPFFRQFGVTHAERGPKQFP